jgi:hypothetical protein
MKTIQWPFGLSLMFCLFLSMPLIAQEPTDRREEQIKAAREKVEKTMQMLEDKLKSNEITERDFNSAIKELMEELEEIIEEVNEALTEARTDLQDAFDMEWDDDDFLTIERDSIKNRVKIKIRDKESRRPRRTRSYFLLNFGPTDIVEGSSAEGIAVPSMELWRSWSGNVGFIVSTRLGSPSSIVHLNYGLLWKFLYLNTKDDLQLSLVDGHPQYIPSPYNETLTYSRFSRQSLLVPLQLRFAGKGANALNIMVGGYGGVRLYAFQDIRFKTDIGERAEFRFRDDYRTNPWQYGVTAAVGQRWWQLYADYEMSNLFRNNPNYEFNVMNAGIQFFF